ncbi:MAG: DHH family phosphoesterase, partial [Candidatus Aenigmatarchaeota archaeon]
NEDLVEYMIYGAIGDRKENSQVFKELLKKYNNGKIVVDFGLKFYGRNKPIHKAIAYSFSPLIPNISGNELAAIEFLREIGIETKNGNEWRTVDSLSEMEIRKIVDGLLSYSVNPEDILGENFSVISREGSFSDVREIASIINACSRLGRIEDGFRFCLGDHKVLNSVEDILEDYRKKLSELIEKIEREYIIEKESIIFIISREIPDTLIGVLVSMVSEIKKDKVVFGIGLDEEIGMLKISARSVKNKNINLRNLLVSIVEELGGEAGGHKNAAGAYIPIGKEKDFMEKIEKIFSDKNGKD